MNTWLPIWNRKEIYITRNMKEMNAVRDVLSVNGINHVIKTNSITNPGRHHGVPNIHSDSAYEYRIYVHKNNCEKAQMLVRSKL